jgi:uncharacterized glyoxalase superfamily protein PhnB
MANVKAVPEGLNTVTPSLVVDGALDAIAFYKKAFGAEEVSRAMDPTGKKVWHADIKIGNSRLFLNDAAPEMGAAAQPSRLFVYVENVDASFQRAVSAGAQVKMPLADMFWGDRMGQVQDKWGNQWSLAQHIKDLTPQQMQKAQDEFVASMPKGKK